MYGFTSIQDWAPEVGDFIEIPAQKTMGCVVRVCKMSDIRIHVVLQENPESLKRQIYHLCENEFEII